MFTVSNKCTTTFMLWVWNHTGELLTLNHLNQSWVKVAPLTTHFMPRVSFNTPWKHLKTCGFLMLSGVMERGQWHEIGCLLCRLCCSRLESTSIKENMGIKWDMHVNFVVRFEHVSASWVMLHKVKIWFCIKVGQFLLIVYKSRVFLLNSTICILCDLLFHVVGKQKYGWGYEHHFPMKAEFCRVSEKPPHLYCFLNPFQANGPF